MKKTRKIIILLILCIAFLIGLVFAAVIKFTKKVPPIIYPELSYFYDFSSQKILVDSSTLKYEIFEGSQDQRPADMRVMVLLYGCDDCTTLDNRRIWYFLAYTKEGISSWRELQEKLDMRSKNIAGGGGASEDIFDLEIRVKNGLRISSPQHPYKWYSLDSPEGVAIINEASVYCGDWSRVRPCSPSVNDRNNSVPFQIVKGNTKVSG